jgi:hypothetical protein
MHLIQLPKGDNNGKEESKKEIRKEEKEKIAA